MSKAPAFQFYVNDWLGDVELQASSSSTRGIWISALCRMWMSRTKGEISGNKIILTRLLNCTEQELDLFLIEVETLGFCYTSREPNGNITVRNRRMFREEKEREKNRLRQKSFYEKKKSDTYSDEIITPPSSSSSSSKRKTPLTPHGGDVCYSEDFLSFWDSYPNKKSKQQAWITWEKLKKAKILPSLAVLQDSIASARKGQDWTRDGGQYIPHPSTWLNRHGWEDVHGPHLTECGLAQDPELEEIRQNLRSKGLLQ